MPTLREGTIRQGGQKILQRHLPQPGQQQKKEEIKNSEPQHIYQILRDIQRNRNIIRNMGVWENETRVVNRSTLMDQGFNFEYFTNILETKKGRYHYCFEFGWMELENGKILLVMTDRYQVDVIRVKRDWEY